MTNKLLFLLNSEIQCRSISKLISYEYKDIKAYDNFDLFKAEVCKTLSVLKEDEPSFFDDIELTTDINDSMVIIDGEIDFNNLLYYCEVQKLKMIQIKFL